MENVILVNENDEKVGLMEKIQAHKEGRLHRAFSVIIFNKEGDMLIHQRAKDKYHCGGLWTNACCSHPRDGEATDAASHRRLKEEMGFDTSIKHIDSFIYKASFENGLIEHEYDHIFAGFYDGEIQPNENEVAHWKYINLVQLKQDIEQHPTLYTPWFKEIIQHHLKTILNHLQDD